MAGQFARRLAFAGRRCATGAAAPCAAVCGGTIFAGSWHLECQDQAQGSIRSFPDMLVKDTATLLKQEPTSKSQELLEVLRTKKAPEMAALYESVLLLIQEVQRIYASTGPAECSAYREPDLKAVLPLYEDFLKHLAAVDAAIFGKEAKPFTQTGWWNSLLRRWRYYICSFFSWGLLTQQAVCEAKEELRKLGITGVADPLASSGWHARLWREVGGFRISASDIYHYRPVSWVKVTVGDAREGVQSWGLPAGTTESDLKKEWAMHLSWPPHSPETVGQDLLQIWPGRYVVLLGERRDVLAGEEGVTGGQAFNEALDRDFERIWGTSIPRWPGYCDDLSIYVRRTKKHTNE